MRGVPSLIHRLTGLLHPEWSLTMGPGRGQAAIRARGERGVRLSAERRRGRIEGGVPVEEAIRCAYDEARLEAPVLAGRCAFTSLRLAALDRPSALEGARLIACDLEGAAIADGDLQALEAQACSLREAELRQTRIGALDLCDLYGARLIGVRLERAWGSDFEGASLESCDLSGADLRGSSFRRARLTGCDLRGAQVAGADFAGARGLDAATRQALQAGGARVRGWSPLQVGAGAVGAALSLGAALLVLTPPPAPVAPALPPPLDRSATTQEREKTRDALIAVRANLERAHDIMIANGAEHRRWPTITEFSENRYDQDGDGPGETHERLFPDGLPENYLTDARGSVLPYCNDVPTQETLAGVDADWHYCELTGRVFASAGGSGEATLNW